ncbi:MAG: peptidoglycan DD-metalloendopeptidase family protein [Oscillospiraceae bacterium]|nr:peptidoglycan DD-metalloendopeptidase family protein [Oscillospiraceae bacterium]
MRKKKWFSRLAVLVLCVLLLGADALPASAVTQADIDKLKDEAADKAEEKKELQAQLDAMADDLAAAAEKKLLLDEQCAVIAEEVAAAEEIIAGYEALLAQTEADLAAAEAREAEQYALFCSHVRAMEERGTISYWSVLFKATSFTDLLSRLDFINEVMHSDQQVINGLRVLQEEIAAKKAEQETQLAEEEAAKAELEARQSELEAKRAEAIEVFNALKADEAAFEAMIAEAEAEQEKLRKEADELAAKLAAEQAARGESTESNPGGYIWPVDSRYITSTVGGRNSPGGVGSTNHKGTDIGRVGYTSPIYASKSGTVIVSKYSDSYGNYVVISHGTGNTTLYAHMSSRSVSVGQYVTQGTVIGITGNTGRSTGPHLHFEIKENGVIINPLSHGAEPAMGYLSGYTLSSTA